MTSSTAVLLLWAVTLNTPSPSTRESNMKAAKTFLTVRVEGHEVGCELLINGIPMFSNAYPGVNSRMPINPWLVEGLNTFTIRNLPVSAATKKNSHWDPTAARSCIVVIAGQDDKGVPTPAIARAEVKPSESAPILSKDGSFTVELGYVEPAWARSAKIGKDAATQKLILAKYREFHRLLATKDLTGIMKFSAAKFKDYSKSLYAADFESERKASFKEQFAGSPGKLIGIDEQEKFGLRYEYYAGDRLVSIKNDEDRSIIQYYNADEGVTTEFPLFFYFDGKDFVLIL